MTTINTQPISSLVAETDAALQATADAVVTKALENNSPVYYSALGLSVEVWPKNQSIFIQATPDVLERLGIKLDDLQAEVL